MLAGQLDSGFHIAQSQGFACVQFAKVNGLGDVCISFRPIFANLEYQPRHEFELPLTQQVGRPEEQAEAFIERGAAPVFKRREGRLHCGLNVLTSCLLVNADQLRRACGIQRTDLIGGANSAPSDDEIVLASELSSYMIQGGSHLPRVF